MKSTLTVCLSSLVLVASTGFACPFSAKKQEMAHLTTDNGNQSVVEQERKEDNNLLVQLQQEKQATSKN